MFKYLFLFQIVKVKVLDNLRSFGIRAPPLVAARDPTLRYRDPQPRKLLALPAARLAFAVMVV